MISTVEAGYRPGEVVRVMSADQDNQSLVGKNLKVEEVKTLDLGSGLSCKMFGIRSPDTQELVWLPFGCLTK